MNIIKINWSKFSENKHEILSVVWDIERLKLRAHMIGFFGFIVFGVIGSIFEKNNLIYLMIASVCVIIITLIYSLFWRYFERNRIQKMIDNFYKNEEKERSNYFYENYTNIQKEKENFERILKMFNQKEIIQTSLIIQLKEMLKNKIDLINELEKEYCLGG